MRIKSCGCEGELLIDGSSVVQFVKDSTSGL